jgi:hypothetical protein
LNSNSIGFGFNLTTFKYIEFNSIEDKWDMSAKKVKLMAHYFVSKKFTNSHEKVLIC